MTWRLIGMFVAVLTFAPGAPAEEAPATAPQQPQRLRVLSYNIHHGEGADGRLDLERISRVITSVEPDLVALQEVDCKARRTGQVDQPAELARLTGMHVAFGENIPLQGGHYGNAVLSRYPITRHKNHLLPSFSDGEQRGALEVEIEVPGGCRQLLFIATHLDYRPDDRERIASAKMINALLADNPGRPAILAGDLNDVPGSKPLREFATEWTVANEEPLPTFPAAEPARQIDFILFRPAQRWKAIEVRVLDEDVASDHRAIFAVLELARKGRCKTESTGTEVGFVLPPRTGSASR